MLFKFSMAAFLLIFDDSTLVSEDGKGFGRLFEGGGIEDEGGGGMEDGGMGEGG